MQHQLLQVPLQDRVLDRAEHDLDVLRVDGVRKVVVDRLLRVLPHVRKHLQDKVLHVQDRVRVAGELRIVPADVRVRVLDLLRQQVRLVQEQDDGNPSEGRVVDDRVEDVARLLEAVRFPKKRILLISSKLPSKSSRFYLSSARTWSNSHVDTRNRIDVTEQSKHLVHFCRCVRWPPTSTNTNGMF